LIRPRNKMSDSFRGGFEDPAVGPPKRPDRRASLPQLPGWARTNQDLHFSPGPVATAAISCAKGGALFLFFFFPFVLLVLF